MEHHRSDVRQAANCGASGDDLARFLRELRQLRDGAGLGHAELAARAHYPYDSILAAEAGPALPDLPVLSAYVRGCGGTAEEWEERWRVLISSPAQSALPTRSAGCSAAATAGARIGSISPAVDGPHPDVVKKALDRIAAEMSGGQPPVNVPVPARAADSVLPPGQDRADGRASPSAATTGTVASAAASTGPAEQPRLVTGTLFPAPSRITTAALIAVVICVLVVVLAVFA